MSEDDYPEFNPYAKIAEAGEEEKPEEEKSEEEPKIKHRSPEKIEELKNLEPAQTELSDQKLYFPKISSLFYSPFINVISDKDNSFLGIGGIYAGMFPRLQMKTGILWLDAFYFPKLKNFT